MVSVDALTPEQFARIIETNLDAIVGRFLEEARERVPAARVAPTPFLRDHLPDVLKGLVSFLRGHGSESEKEHSTVLARCHGQERAKSPLYTAGQLRMEYATVRRIIMTLLSNEQVLMKETTDLYAQFCELTLSVTTESFLVHQIVNPLRV